MYTNKRVIALIKNFENNFIINNAKRFGVYAVIFIYICIVINKNKIIDILIIIKGLWIVDNKMLSTINNFFYHPNVLGKIFVFHLK